jgi:hypothetical protein
LLVSVFAFLSKNVTGRASAFLLSAIVHAVVISIDANVRAAVEAITLLG